MCLTKGTPSTQPSGLISLACPLWAHWMVWTCTKWIRRCLRVFIRRCVGGLYQAFYITRSAMIDGTSPTPLVIGQNPPSPSGQSQYFPFNHYSHFSREIEMRLQVKNLHCMFNSQSTNCKSLKDKTNCEESASYNRHSHYKPQQNTRMVVMLGTKNR